MVDEDILKLWSAIRHTELGLMVCAPVWLFPTALVHPAFVIGALLMLAWSFVLQRLRWNALGIWIRG